MPLRRNGIAIFLSLEIMLNSYRFVEFDPFQRIWTELGTDDQFRFRELPEDLEFELLLEDNSVLLELDATDLSVDDDEQDATAVEPT